MPKVTINEIDQSRYVQSGGVAPMVVLVPGTASFGPVFSKESPEVHTFSGAAGLQDFYRLFGYSPAVTTKQTIDNKSYVSTIDGDFSFEYVTNLLLNGASVQFARINEGTAATSTPILTDIGNGLTGLNTFTARYSGRFGNRLVVKFNRIADSATDAIIAVYMKPTSMKDSVGLADLSKCTLLENFRVSTNPASAYFGNLNAFKYLENITSDTLITFIKNSTDTVSIYELSGGLDFCEPLGYSDSADAEAFEDDILDKIYKVLTTDFYENFSDPYLFDFDFVTSGGFVTAFDSTDAANDSWNKLINTEGCDAIHAAMISLCETRGDCFALLDTPKAMSAYSADNSAMSVSMYASKLDTSYAALYAPWASIVSASTGGTLDMPPSYLFMASILKGMTTNANTDLWYVPAGVTRAAAPFIVSPQYEIGSVILNKFQNDNNYRVNPIMRVRNYGYCVYGNATCKQSLDGVGRSALESVNVRLLCNVIKKAIFAVCSGLAFEYNDSRLWAKFYSQMDKVLVYMKRNYGLYDYKIVMDGTTVTSAAMNERRVPGKIMISPTLAGEFFDIDFEIAPSGVSFNEEA